MYLLELFDSNQNIFAIKIYPTMKEVYKQTNGLINYNDLYHDKQNKKRRKFNCKQFIKISKIV